MVAARRAQVTSLDLVMSVFLFILFIALIIGYVLITQGSEPIRYGESLIGRITFIDDGRVLDRTAFPPDEASFGRELLRGTEYSEESRYCITLESSTGQEPLVGTDCGPPPCVTGSGIDRFVTHVLDATQVKRLTLWVCT